MQLQPEVVSRQPLSGGPLVAVLDPSAFTLPYDYAFCRSLSGAGIQVILFTRDLRRGEPTPPAGVVVLPWFYRASEKGLGRWPALAPGLRFAKGLEHGFDLMRFVRWCERARPRVVHFQWTALPVLDRLAVRRLGRHSRVVLTVHDTKAFLGSASSRLQYWSWGAVLDEADHLIVHTEDGARTLRERGIRTPITVIPHGPLEFGSKPEAISEEPEILLFGILKPYKGADLLLEAFARIPPEVRGAWRLRIAGKPQMDSAPLMDRAAALGIAGSVRWDLRYIEDPEIGALFARASILAFPYRNIDSSGVLMGALGFRKAMVASRIGAFAELLRDGETALLVPREDVESLRRALEALMTSESLRARLAASSYEFFRSQLPSWPEISRKTLAVYDAPSPA